MMKVLSSASRIVFILMTLALIAGMFISKIDPKDFIVLCGMAFTYYFTKQSSPTDNSIKQ
jgi:hypothetical protein